MMKKIFIFVLALGLVISSISFAQTQSTTPSSPAAQGEYKTILDYKNELSLTDSQVKNLQELANKTRQYVIEKRKALISLSSELNDLINKKADLKLIRNKLEQMAMLRVDITYSEIEAARRLENILTPSQMQKWKDIRQEYLEKLRASQATLEKPASPPATKK